MRWTTSFIHYVYACAIIINTSRCDDTTNSLSCSLSLFLFAFAFACLAFSFPFPFPFLSFLLFLAATLIVGAPHLLDNLHSPDHFPHSLLFLLGLLPGLLLLLHNHIILNGQYLRNRERCYMVIRTNVLLPKVTLLTKYPLLGGVVDCLTPMCKMTSLVPSLPPLLFFSLHLGYGRAARNEG